MSPMCYRYTILFFHKNIGGNRIDQTWGMKMNQRKVHQITERGKIQKIQRKNKKKG